MEIKNLKELKNSDEWKEFQAFKKGSKTTAQEQTVVTKQATIGEQLKSKPKVPNLNRTATSVVPGKEKANDQEDDLFQGHYSNA